MLIKPEGEIQTAMKRQAKFIYTILSIVFSCAMMSCETIQLLGKERRENLSFHVEKAQVEQEEAKKEFQSALEEFSSLVNIGNADLEMKYNQLNDHYENCVARAKQINNRIGKIESAAQRLFLEWEDELQLYSNRNLRDASRKKLTGTKDRYYDLVASMKRSESKMKPILTVFHDNVLFLKHNLNAVAIGALQGEVESLEQNVAALIQELEKSIAEAGQLINSIQN